MCEDQNTLTREVAGGAAVDMDMGEDIRAREIAQRWSGQATQEHMLMHDYMH